MTLEQIKRLNEDKLRKIYNAIISTNDLVNIQQVKGKDLEIKDTDKYEYILTYSFPCQDLSLAGKGAGMSRDGGTRSGMLWEVERIFDELSGYIPHRHKISKKIFSLGEPTDYYHPVIHENLPQILIMENVPQVIGQNNIKDFQSWRDKLEKLGYSNYIEVLNAKDYGIPQNRERAFMVSILGEYNYRFPSKIKLEKKLKDMLEEKVDEKYYLSDKQISQVIHWNAQQEPLETLGKDCSPTLTTRSGAYAAGMVLTSDLENKEEKLVREELLKIKNATKQGYLLAEDGVGIDISSRMEYHRGTVQQGTSQTLDTKCGVGVVVKDKCIGTYDYAQSENFMMGRDRMHLGKEISGALVAGNTHNGIVLLGGIGEKKSNSGTQWYQQDRIYDDNIAISVTTSFNPYYKNNLRIRKLTGKECYRLMGFSDEDCDNARKVLSENMIYHTAGDSIVVNVLMAIFKQMIK